MGVEAYEVGQRSDKRGVNLISDALPFGRLWYGESNAVSNAVDYARFRSRSHDAGSRLRCTGQRGRNSMSTRVISKSPEPHPAL